MIHNIQICAHFSADVLSHLFMLQSVIDPTEIVSVSLACVECGDEDQIDVSAPMNISFISVASN